MQTIIITTDFSESSLNAAKYGAALAKPLGVGHIILYHSYDNAPLATEVPVAETDTPLAHEGSLLALEIVEEALKQVLGDAANVSIELVANGSPLVFGVQQLAEQHRAALVVAGATGKSSLERMLIGSSAVGLASDHKVPLLIVPKEARFTPIEKVVFACDLKQVSHTTPVAEIGIWLERLRAKLLVLHVALEGKRFNPDLIPEQYTMHSLLDGLDPEYHYTESDDIADEIEDFAEDHGAGLIITIPKSYGFFERLFHRSVSKRLIKASEIPLLLLRERGSV